MGTSAVANPRADKAGMFQELLGGLVTEVGRLENAAAQACGIADRYTGTTPKPDDLEKVTGAEEAYPLIEALRRIEGRLETANNALMVDLGRMDEAWR